ncbi:hypothetical protein ABT120_19940 [Nonomuraea angiospora]|uniref:hypothetical protein n=1 Tax=Nonomuraea angiospora TaxID=46172 RepID=UPI0033263091
MVGLAQIIGEIGPMLERGLAADHLAAEAGIAPSPGHRQSHTVSFWHSAERWQPYGPGWLRGVVDLLI